MGTDDLKLKAFGIFEKMQRGDVIIIKEFASRDPATFIQYCKDWIDDHPNYEFNKDYKMFRKMYFDVTEIL